MLLKKYIIVERQRILGRVSVNTLIAYSTVLEQDNKYRLECRNCSYRTKNRCNYKYGLRCIRINDHIIYNKYKPVLCLLKGLL